MRLLLVTLLAASSILGAELGTNKSPTPNCPLGLVAAGLEPPTYPGEFSFTDYRDGIFRDDERLIELRRYIADIYQLGRKLRGQKPGPSTVKPNDFRGKPGAKALSVLNLMGKVRKRVTEEVLVARLEDISLKMSRSDLHELMNAMERRGWIRRYKNKDEWILRREGLRMINWGAAYYGQETIAQ